MKKFSLFLSAMLISMMSFAGVVTFDADVDKGNAGTDSNNAAAYTITKDGVTVEVSSGILGTYNNEAHYRVYKNQTLTITSTVGNITSVEFTCTANGDAKYGPGCFTADSGDYTNDGAAVGTWTGSATEITFTASANQVRATQIVVTVGEGGETPEPEPEPEPTPDPEEPETPVLPEGVITCAEALAICLETGETSTTETYTIQGYVTEIKTAYNSQYGNISFWMADTKDGGQVLQAYRVKPVKAGEENVKVGDFVEVQGTLVNYKSNTPEVNAGGTYTILTAAEGGETPEPELPEVETVGAGTEENPFTVEDVIALNNTLSGKQYVKAYIVGQAVGQSFVDGLDMEAPFEGATNSDGSVATQGTNLAIASSKTAEVANIIPVQLPKGALRDDFNLVENPEMLGKEVVICGELIKYFGLTGIKNPTSIVVVEEDVEEPETPIVPAATWTVAGTPIFGTAWDQTDANNDMRLQDDGTYVWEKTDLTLAANTQIEFKVVKDHAWDEAYPASNYKFSVAEDGIYTITITFDPTSTEVAAVATKTGDAEINVEISYVLMGVAGDWTTGIALTANPDNANEYVLLGQEITEGDAVKVVTLTDGVPTAYCGNVDEYSVAHTADADGNIVLDPGTYDFYYKVAEDLIYIAAAGPVDPTPDPEEPKDITVKAKVPAEWTDQITVWVWPTGGEGQEAVPTQEGEWYVYTANVAELNIIFKNGAGWTGAQNQTEDITVTESTCIEITYNADGKAKHTEVDCEGGTPVDPTPDPDPTPGEVTYVLMGVAGDWTTGIALTANPENENEYMLLGQEIAEGDAVKVVTLTNGEPTAWCGNVDEWSVEHQFDENGNIILAPGTYDFYYKVAEDLIYIGASEEPGDEPGDAIDATFVFNTEEGLTALGIELPVTDAGNGAFKTDLDETAVYTSNGVGMSVTHKADGSENGKTRIWKKASGALDLRIYKDGGSLTFAAPEGNAITKVVFDGAKINFAVGEDAVVDNTWEGNATSVTFAATATCNVNTVTVTYEAAEEPDPGITTGLDNVQGEVKVLKTIKNGQLIIVRDGKEFNAQGAVVK